MRGLLKPLLLPLLRRDPLEIDRQAALFRIESESERALVIRLGRAFLGGYNDMLALGDPAQVAVEGSNVDVHFRPFYFEGAAMGYLAKSMISDRFRAADVERTLLAMDARFLYLYYVGLGFWYGFRHRRRPERLEQLAPHIDPLYFPLCYDGFGFKLGFFDFPKDGKVVRRLERAPERHRSFIYQGFGRSMHFVFMEDEPGFERLRSALPERYRADLDIGRSLAYGFTRTDRPVDLMGYLGAADDAVRLGSRLTGITWALSARKMNDPDYFERCTSAATASHRRFLSRLPALCERALEESTTYADWQARTRAAALAAY